VGQVIEKEEEKEGGGRLRGYLALFILSSANVRSRIMNSPALRTEEERGVL